MKLWIGLTVCWVILAMVFFLLPVYAQDTSPHPSMTNPHEKDPYSGKYNWQGDLCCNGNDCEVAQKPEQFKPVSDGILIKPTGEIVDSPHQGISPDGHWHICRWPAKTGPVRCLLIPNGGV